MKPCPNRSGSLYQRRFLGGFVGGDECGCCCCCIMRFSSLIDRVIERLIAPGTRVSRSPREQTPGSPRSITRSIIWPDRHFWLSLNESGPHHVLIQLVGAVIGDLKRFCQFAHTGIPLAPHLIGFVQRDSPLLLWRFCCLLLLASG